MVALFGRVDVVVVRAIEPLHHRLEARHVRSSIARRQPLLAGRLLHLLSVLVGAGQKIDVVAVEPHEARDGVGGDRLVGVADMRRPVWV